MSDVELRWTDLEVRFRICRPELKLGTSWALTASAASGHACKLRAHGATPASMIKHASSIINLILHGTSNIVSLSNDHTSSMIRSKIESFATLAVLPFYFATLVTLTTTKISLVGWTRRNIVARLCFHKVRPAILDRPLTA